MKRVFSMDRPLQVPDGTTVYPFPNPKDCTSGLPAGLFEGFSLSGGKIDPGGRSRIHIMPLVTHVTFVRRGHLHVVMKDPDGHEPYHVNLEPDQAVLTLPGTFFQLINENTMSCETLYVVSPQYLFVFDDGRILYDDSIVFEEDWDDLAAAGWRPEKLVRSNVNHETRESFLHQGA